MKLLFESKNAAITRYARCVYFLMFFSLLGFAIPAQAQFFERWLRDLFNYDPPAPKYDSIEEFIAEEFFDCGLVFFRDVDNIIDLGFCDDTPTEPPPDPTTPTLPAPGQFATFESGQVRPLALSPDGSRLYAVNTPDSRVEIFDVTAATPVLIDSVSVGLEPVALALGNNNELWVVNHLSDSVSIIDLSRSPAVVKNTLLVGDEPRDIVFAGGQKQWAFITAAHRGQNIPFDPQLTTPGVGRADVWVFNAHTASDSTTNNLGGEPATILTMFGDTLRALAVNGDGSRVYAAVFNSGNKTTVLTDDREEGGIEKPNPIFDREGFFQPDTGLIVQFDGSNWKDSGDPINNSPPQIWDDRVNLHLPDYDVFTINTSGSLPEVIAQHQGVGTTLFNIAVNPINNRLYVSNQEALNLTRFEGPGNNATTVRGHFVENRITVIDEQAVKPRHLNKHIDYSTALGSPSEKANALAIPLGMAVSGDGNALYLVAMGSNKLARFNTQALDDNSFSPVNTEQLLLTGGGPTGIVLDELRQRAYVMTRFDNGISVVDTTTQLQEIAHVTLFNPEPEHVQQGRPFLYDANYTSSRGDSSCAGCHIFGDMDHLAWDLGNPDAVQVANNNRYNPNVPESLRNPIFHPMKGPMTTQSLRGLRGNGPMHWRGDRTGESASSNETLEEQAFEDFNVAFVELLGRESELTEQEMDMFAKFALELIYPPNPVANLDNSLTSTQRNAMNDYDNLVLDRITTCNGCHVLDVKNNQFGTDGNMSIEGPSIAEDMKIPHLRNMYQKIGMFAKNTQVTSEPYMGDQIRGFGFDNSGASGSLDIFFREEAFTLTAEQRNQFVELVLAFPSELNPIVGQQVTITTANSNFSEIRSRLDLLVERASVTEPRPECELIANAVIDNQTVGWVMASNQQFIASTKAITSLDSAELISLAAEHQSPITFTCVPPGNGARMGVGVGVDRNNNGVIDNDEN